MAGAVVTIAPRQPEQESDLMNLMLSPVLKKRKTATKGLGIFATKFIPKGTITCFECAKCKRFSSPNELSLLPKDLRKHILEYSYEKADGVLLFPCDDVIYINHSCNSNTLGTGLGFDIAVRDIKNGEEITFDYRMFYEDKWRGNSYYTKFVCQCGEPTCERAIQFINPEHPAPPKLTQDWDTKISSSLRLIRRVDQPLWDELLKARIR
jgi:hypothetical protein